VLKEFLERKAEEDEEKANNISLSKPAGEEEPEIEEGGPEEEKPWEEEDTGS